MIDMSKIGIDYWLGQGAYPWKEEGYGGGMAGYQAWESAGYPQGEQYYNNLLGGDVNATPVPGYGGDVQAQSAYPQFSSGAAYGTSDYWGSQGLFPWKEMGFGGGAEGIRAWEAAGSPLPAGYTGGGGTAATPGTTTAPTTTIASYPEYSPSEAYTGAGNIQYPPQWQTASDALTQFAQGLPTQLPELWEQGSQLALQMAQTGMPTAVPEEWTQASQYAQQMAETGLPVDISAWWAAQQPVYERTIQEQTQQAAEEAGLTGLRWSTPLQNTMGRIVQEASQNLWSQLSGQEIATQEAARGRQQEAISQLLGIGAGQAGLSEAAAGRAAGAIPDVYQYAQLPAALTEAAKNRGLTAAQSLMGLGGQYAQLPLDIAQQSLTTGLALQQAQQAEYDRYMQEFLRTASENNPYLQYALALAGAGGGQYAQTTYDQGWLSQLLNMGTSGALIYALLSSAKFKKDISKIENTEETTIAKKMLNTPIFKYRYKFEPSDGVPHLGLITESSPGEVTLFNRNMIGLYEYISALHATIKDMGRRIIKLEE